MQPVTAVTALPRGSSPGGGKLERVRLWRCLPASGRAVAEAARLAVLPPQDSLRSTYLPPDHPAERPMPPKIGQCDF